MEYKCKGCEEVIDKKEFDEGKGWCRLCVILDYDFMDSEKYKD